MESLARLVVTFCDLLEAEARLLRRRAVEAAGGVALVLLALFCAALGVAFMGKGLYLLLSRHWGPLAASGASGAVFLLSGGVLWWIARRDARS